MSERNLIACPQCGERVEETPIRLCATCAYGPQWSKSSVGARNVAEDYARRHRKAADRGLRLVG